MTALAVGQCVMLKHNLPGQFSKAKTHASQCALPTCVCGPPSSLQCKAISESKQRNERPAFGALVRDIALVAVVGLDHRVDLLLRGLQVEGSRVLHRRVVDGRFGKFRDLALDEDEPPELAGIELVHIAPAGAAHPANAR